MVKDIMEVFNKYGEFVYLDREPHIEIMVTGKWTDVPFDTGIFEDMRITSLTNESKENIERLIQIVKKWKTYRKLNSNIAVFNNNCKKVFWLTTNEYEWFVNFVPDDEWEGLPNEITDISFTYSVGSIVTEFKFREENSNE